MQYNNCIAAMMSFINVANKWKEPLHPAVAEQFAICLSPFAPHIAEELWANHLGCGRPRRESLFESPGQSSCPSASCRHAARGSIAHAEWPELRAAAEVSEIRITVQFNGKARGAVVVGAEESKEGVLAAVEADLSFDTFAGKRRAVPEARFSIRGGYKRRPPVSAGALGAQLRDVRCIFVPGKVVNFVSATARKKKQKKKKAEEGE